MSDGSRLKQSWYSALNEAEERFRQFLTSPTAEWKRVSHTADRVSPKQKGKARATSVPELADVVVHRNSTKAGEDVYRMVLEVSTGEEQVSLEPWKAVLTTAELQQEWDPAVEDAHLVEMFDRNTRISKTNYSLGWPANPRDSVTISRAFFDNTTLIDITTSLPRSPDEPAYLRPSPPFVRSNVQLFAWCIQHVQPQPPSPTETKKPAGGRLRITCFWQHDLKALWGFGSSTAALAQQLATMTLSLLKTVIKRGGRVPKLAGYGNGISIERVRYQIDREALTIDYAIIPDDEEHQQELGLSGMDEVHALREHRRLTRSIECVLPSLEGWDVQVTMKGSSEEVESIPWSAHAMRSSSNPSTFSPPDQVLLRLTYGALTDDDAVLKVKVVIEVSGGTRGLRLNGLATQIHDLEERDPSSHIMPQKMLQDVASAADLSFQTSSSLGTVSSAGSTAARPLTRPSPERTPAADKSILSKVRRNYIYFSSLLQEPEAKWRRTTEARGVSITQLDSIDPTLVVYRAEATFVGVGLWDLYGAVVSPGARVYWDKQHEDGVLLEDVNELTELWHFKTKPAWPVNGRDSVVLKTVYKSPTTIHVFSFSADDPHLFPHIPPAEPNVIRTQVDLQGWAIEALSPTTTLLTLLEQSDPKGWTNKTSIPTQMINTLAGIGEFAIKCGGPPVVTRLAGSKANELRYDHERGMFKVEYEPSTNRRSTSNTSSEGHDDSLPTIECEVRCDIDTWAASLDIVVDPPPQTITCLRRHRLSAEGGGLWITLTHDSIFVDDERLLALVRRAPGKEKGLVMVNGAKVQVDVEELPEHEIKSLTRQKRVKPPRIPLDQPPVMGVIRRRKAEWGGGESDAAAAKSDTGSNGGSSWASAPRISSPLSRFFTYYVEQATTTTQQAVAAISPANVSGGALALDPAKAPMQYALDALAWTQEFNARSPPQANNGSGWTLVGDKGMVVERKLMPEISPFIPVHKGFKVIEGVSAEELASVILELDCRKTWDERFDSARVLEAYGGQARTTFMVAKGGFPFRDRGFYLANIMAREHNPFSSTSSSSLSLPLSRQVSDQSPAASRNAIFCVAASFSPESPHAQAFASAKYNSYALPIGRVYLDAWILETLDPYTKENYTIPSSRCTRLVAVDYAGSIPAAFNSMINATMARAVLGVETYIKNQVKVASLPFTRLPAPGLILRNTERHFDAGAVGVGNATATSSSGSGATMSDDVSGSTTSTVGGGVVGADAGAASAVTVLPVPEMGWKLRRRDERRVLLETKFDVERKVYRCSVLLGVLSSSSSVSASRRDATIGMASTNTTTNTTNSTTTTSATANENANITPRPSRLMLSSSPNASRRIRQPSDQSIPDTIHSATSDSTLVPSTISPTTSSSVPAPEPTPLLSMPGGMSMPTSVGGSGGAMSFPSGASSISNSTSTGASGSFASASTSSRPVGGGGGGGAMPTSPPHSRTSSMSMSPPPRIRQRAASSGGGAGFGGVVSPSSSPGVYYYGMPGEAQPPPHVRGRTASSAFTVKGEVRLSTDLVVMEVVVDARMFGDGASGSGSGSGYAVDVKARKRAELVIGGSGGNGERGSGDAVALSVLDRGGDASLAPTPTPTSTTPSSSSPSLVSTSKPQQQQELDLPFIYTVHTMPSSPLHSSGLSVEAPLRHLLRISLPTAQYRVSSVRDPLTGEMRGAKPKPAWLEEMEREGGGLVVEVGVRALGVGEKGLKDKDGNGKVKGGSRVWVNAAGKGVEVGVVGEKESLTNLGREELLDDRTARMGILSRTPNEAEALPDELKAPIGVADDLLVPPMTPVENKTVSGGILGKGDNGEEVREASKKEESGERNGVESQGNGEDSPGTPKTEMAAGGGGPHGGLVGSSGPGGLLGFFQMYHNPLTRFTGGGAASSSGATDDGAITGTTATSGAVDVSVPGGMPDGGSISAPTETISGRTSGTETSSMTMGIHRREYPLSTVILVGLIAFLIGSLLRSLLSPADFIYVVTDLGEAETANSVGGWREIRRLLELKYFVGGWDFQVAVVRRHLT